MATSAQDSDKDELIDSDQNQIADYGGTAEDEVPTKSLEEVYNIIGMLNFRPALLSCMSKEKLFKYQTIRMHKIHRDDVII